MKNPADEGADTLFIIETICRALFQHHYRGRRNPDEEVMVHKDSAEQLVPAWQVYEPTAQAVLNALRDAGPVRVPPRYIPEWMDAPWTVAPVIKPGAQILGGSGRLICSFEDHPFAYGRARMAAAAPRLFDALESLRRLDDHMIAWNGNRYLAPPDTVRMRVDTVLSAAMGGRS